MSKLKSYKPHCSQQGSDLFIKLTFLRLLPDIDFQNLEKVIFFLALLWLLWRSWFSEVLTLPFRQCFCCIFRKCSLGPGWIENLNTKTADLRLAPAEIWWVAPFVSIGLAQPSKICFHPFLPPNPLSFICPSVPLSLSSLSSLLPVNKHLLAISLVPGVKLLWEPIFGGEGHVCRADHQHFREFRDWGRDLELGEPGKTDRCSWRKGNPEGEKKILLEFPRKRIPRILLGFLSWEIGYWGDEKIRSIMINIQTHWRPCEVYSRQRLPLRAGEAPSPQVGRVSFVCSSSKKPSQPDIVPPGKQTNKQKPFSLGLKKSLVCTGEGPKAKRCMYVKL